MVTKSALFRYFRKRIKKKNCSTVRNQHPDMCLIAKFSAKTTILKFGTKNNFFHHFWGTILKNYCEIWNQQPQICVIVKFCEKTKMLSIGTKNALFFEFWGRNLTTIVIFQIRILKFFKLQNFAKKENCLCLEHIFPYLRIFLLEFQKGIVIFEISTLKFV